MGLKIQKRASRTFTTGLIDLAENLILSWESIARAALGYMSEDEVQDLAESEFEVETDEDEED